MTQAAFRFTSDASAPLASPYTEDGLSLTLVQNDGQFSKSNGRLNLVAQSSFAWGDQGLYLAVSRAAGLLIFGRFYLSSPNLWKFGYGNNAASVGYDEWTIYSNVARLTSTDLPLVTLASSGNQDIQLGVMLLNAGALYLQRVSANGALVHYVSRTNTQASGAARLTNGMAAGTFDDFVIGTVDDARYTSDYGLAKAHVATPVDGEIITTDAETLIEFTWTPATSEALTLLFQRADDDNGWKLVADQAAGTIKLYQRVGGNDTEVDSGKTQTWTAGMPHHIVVKCMDWRIRTYVAGVAKHNYVTGEAFPSGRTAKVSGFTSGAHFAATPYRIDLPNLDITDQNDYCLAYGDSKTWGSGDTGTNGTNGYPPRLTALTGLQEMRPCANRSGYTVATAKPVVDADLLIASGYHPRSILLNFGSNDLFAGATEAQYKADYAYIIDAFHVRYPDALIFIADAWRRGYDAASLAMAGWNADLRATRHYTRRGIDEYVVLRGDDNGATNTNDGIHPNPTGYDATAAAWQAAMGF